jgi:hypothetical protein
MFNEVVTSFVLANEGAELNIFDGYFFQPRAFI